MKEPSFGRAITIADIIALKIMKLHLNLEEMTRLNVNHINYYRNHSSQY